MSKNWYIDTWRKLHWDFTNTPYIGSMGAKFDSAATAAALKKAGAQAIGWIVKGYEGYSYYDTKIGYKHPALKRNLSRELIDACHENGIRVIIDWISAADNLAGQLPLSWCCLDAQGNPGKFGPNVQLVCLNSPYFEKVVAPTLQEITRDLHPDGFFFDDIHYLYYRPCYSRYCEEAFKKDFGRPIPREEHDPAWPTYLRWRRGLIYEYERKAAEIIHGINPDVFVASLWGYTTLTPVDVPDFLDYITGDAETDLILSFEARYISSLGKPFCLMTNRFVHGWRDWMIRPVASMKQEVAAVMANGGRTFIGDNIYPDGSPEPEALKSIGEVFKFVSQREKHCRKAEPVPYMGILHSDATHFFNQAALMAKKWWECRYATPSALGAHKALRASNIHFNIFNEKTLLRSLASYQTLILPEQTCLSREAGNVIKKFVETGGGLLASYNTGTRDEENRTYDEPIFSELFGVKYVGDFPYSFGYIRATDNRVKSDVEIFPMLTDGRFLKVKPTTASRLCSLLSPAWIEDFKGPPGDDSGFPAVTCNQFGKGKVVFVAGEIFRAYWERNNPYLKRLIANLINIVTPVRLLEVKSPPYLEVTLFRQGMRKIVHLVVPSPGGGSPYQEFIPSMFDIVVKLRVDREPVKVVQMPENILLNWKLEESCVTFHVPRVDIHTCIVVE